MSTVKISQLAQIQTLDANTSNTLFVGVDIPSGVTGKITATTIAQKLYSYNQLNVGNNSIILPNVIAQFSGSSSIYNQVNLQNINGNGSGDYVVTANNGTDATYFIDLGINGSLYSDPNYSAMSSNDGYLYVQGSPSAPAVGNLVIGTASSAANIAFMTGGTQSQNIRAFITNQGIVLSGNSYFRFNDGSIQTVAAAPFVYTQAAFDTANSATSNTIVSQGINLTQNTAIQSAYNQSNTAQLLGQAAYNQANVTIGVDATQNASITVIQGVDATQNLAITSVYNQHNTTSLIAQSSFNKANNALANTTGTFAGDLSVSGNISVLGTTSSTGPIATGNLIVSGTTSLTGNVNMNAATYMTGAVTVNSTMLLANSLFSPTQAALTISASPTVVPPANDGYMIHISGKNGIPSRIVSDSYGTGAYSVYASRTARGNVSNPSPVQAGDIIGRFSANGYGNTKFQQFGTGRIDFVAAENYTDTTTASQIQFWNCAAGTNTLTQIATFNGTSVVFAGIVNPQKGLLLSPNVLSGITTTLNIDIANNSLYYFKTNATTTINLSGFATGKIVEVWLTNTDTGGGSNHTITHGCLANNSTIGATSFTLTSLHSAYLKYFSIDGDLANTYVSINYS